MLSTGEDRPRRRKSFYHPIITFLGLYSSTTIQQPYLLGEPLERWPSDHSPRWFSLSSPESLPVVSRIQRLFGSPSLPFYLLYLGFFRWPFLLLLINHYINEKIGLTKVWGPRFYSEPLAWNNSLSSCLTPYQGGIFAF